MGKFRLIKFVFLLITFAYSVNMHGIDHNYILSGTIVDNFTGKGLDSVTVTLMTNDSIELRSCMNRNNDDGYYQFGVSKIGKYIIKAERKGYEVAYKNAELKNHRENTIFVERIRMNKIYELKEVTVTSTKIKMVMKGDTIVYNADAFNLAEGSMLDALISKLPGANLNKNGEIFVNGKKIESLLVNGKNFFSGNPTAALENLPAYTVSKIKVYDQEGHASRMMKRDMDDKQYVMDVRLKKEYSTGYLGNLEGGLGSEDRYKLKVVGQRFSDRGIMQIYSDISTGAINWHSYYKSSNKVSSLIFCVDMTETSCLVSKSVKSILSSAEILINVATSVIE